MAGKRGCPSLILRILRIAGSKALITRIQILSFNESKQIQIAPIVRRAHDGLDRPALPRFPSLHYAAHLALYRNGDDRRVVAWQCCAASRL